MVLSYLFSKPSANQTAVFEAVAPIVKRTFPRASAFISTRHSEIVFNCGYSEFPEPHKQVCFPPDEHLLKELVNGLNNLAKAQKSKIKFLIWCEDIGGAVPMGVYARWGQEDIDESYSAEDGSISNYDPRTEEEFEEYCLNH